MKTVTPVDLRALAPQVAMRSTGPSPRSQGVCAVLQALVLRTSLPSMAHLGRNRRDGVAKLSGPPLLVLTSLAAGPKHGYALMKDVEAFSGVRLGAGTLHGAIGRLEERGLIASMPEERQRRPYRITDEGAVMLREVIDELGRVVEEGRARLVRLPAAHAALRGATTSGGAA